MVVLLNNVQARPMVLDRPPIPGPQRGHLSIVHGTNPDPRTPGGSPIDSHGTAPRPPDPGGVTCR